MLKTYILIGRDNELNLVAIVKVLIFSVRFNELKLNLCKKEILIIKLRVSKISAS